MRLSCDMTTTGEVAVASVEVFMVDDVRMKETHSHKYWTHEEAPDEKTASALCGKLRSTICNQEDGRLQLA